MWSNTTSTNWRHRIGDQHLLCQADDEDPGAGRRPRPGCAGARAVAAPRSCSGRSDPPRAAGTTRCRARPPPGRRLARKPSPIDVDDVGQAVEGEERDAERQRDVRQATASPKRSQQDIEVGGDEIGIFEGGQQQQIGRHGDAKCHCRARGPLRASITTAARVLNAMEAAAPGRTTALPSRRTSASNSSVTRFLPRIEGVRK